MVAGPLFMWSVPLAAPTATAAPATTGATITVTTAADELGDTTPCSLRAAVLSADLDQAIDGCTAGVGADTIVVPPGPTSSPSPAPVRTRRARATDLSGALTISGTSAIIDGGGISPKR